MEASSGEEERLQKVLARAGFGSRRFCETLISEGRVAIDGQVVRELGVRVDPRRAAVTVDGEPIRVPKLPVYLAVYKPRGVLSDAGSPDDSVPTVLEMAPPDSGHLFPIGRLDLRSEGLILLTSDGDVTHRLTHPSFAHAKVYYVLVEKRPGEAELIRLRNGIELEQGITAPARVEVVEHLPTELRLDTGPQRGVWLRFELTEGKKRQLRHMTAAVGLPTLRLIRWAIGPLALRGMMPGSVRTLTRVEIQKLREYAGLESSRADSPRQGRDRRAGRTGGGRANSQSTRGPAATGQRSRRGPGQTQRAGAKQGAGAKPGAGGKQGAGSKQGAGAFSRQSAGAGKTGSRAGGARSGGGRVGGGRPTGGRKGNGGRGR